MTHRLLPLLLIIIADVVSGCDTINAQQYRIAGVQAGSDDAKRIERVVTAVAAQYGLKDITQTSPVPRVLVVVDETDITSFHTEIGARLYDDDALVDVLGGFGPRTRKFQQVRDKIGASLAAEFGARCVIVPRKERIHDGLAGYR